MTNEKWKDTLAKIKEKFEIIEEGKEKFEDEGGILIEYITFNCQAGKIRLELVTKPVVLDKKVMYSNRIGSMAKIDYTYSDTEVQSNMNAYKWSGDNWVELKENIFD
ncbi:MAG: hypothetical protein NT091_00850 [Candidatus Falkowbacteria bacterium]|nr:hypothetical protein [Candidatus Falkowbacteria bacterium]